MTVGFLLDRVGSIKTALAVEMQPVPQVELLADSIPLLFLLVGHALAKRQQGTPLSHGIEVAYAYRKSVFVAW
jgi:hypothetical protein